MSIAPITPPNPLEIAGARELAEPAQRRGRVGSDFANELAIEGIDRPASPDRADGRARLDLGESFATVLENAHAAEKASNRADVQFANGDPSVGIHEVVIAAEKANISVRFMTTLKNKALEAYRELINTQV